MVLIPVSLSPGLHYRLGRNILTTFVILNPRGKEGQDWEMVFSYLFIKY